MHESSGVKTISEQVYQRLRGDLLMGSLDREEWLREAQLAASLGVSRTPVREAVKRLAQEGLLELSPNRGVRIRKLTTDTALDLYAVRSNLEGMAARLAAGATGSTDMAKLRLHLDRMSDLPPSDYRAQIQADDEFHLAIAQLSRNDSLLELIAQISGRITRVKILTRDTNTSLTTYKQHKAILAAIEAGSATQAEAAMQQHIHTYMDVIRQRLRDSL